MSSRNEARNGGGMGWAATTARHYAFFLIAGIVVWLFHSNVNARFSQMTMGLQVATTLQNSAQKMQLELFDHYRESMCLHNASRKDAKLAYEYELQANGLAAVLQKETKLATSHHADAEEMAEQAQLDRATGLKWQHESDNDNVTSIEAKRRGQQLAQLAEKEAYQAKALLDHSIQEDQEGRTKLVQAQDDLQAAKDLRGAVTIQDGICKWFAWACALIQLDQAEDGDSSTASKEQLQEASNKAIVAASDMQDALSTIEEAKGEREYALEIFYSSSIHSNRSIAMLEAAKVLEARMEKEQAKAIEYLAKADSEQQEADEDEVEASIEDADIAKDRGELIYLYNASRTHLLAARQEEKRARDLEIHIPEDRENLEAEELRVRRIVFEAKQHVAHACWYALVVCMAATAMLILATARIVRTCQTSHPAKWIVRGRPYTGRDVSFLVNHILIFLVAMGFVGELLLEYGSQSLLGEVYILLVSSLVCAYFQTFCLLFLPNLFRMISDSTCSRSNFLTLLCENVAKKSFVIFAVFALEILLCWINAGDILFLHAYQLNVWCSWSILLGALLVHLIIFERPSGRIAESVGPDDHEVEDAEGNPRDDEATETSTLVSPDTVSTLTSEESSSLMLSINLGSSGRRSATPYGSMTATEEYQLSPEIESSFVTSWGKEGVKLLFLLEFVIASWAIWIIRLDVALIIMLSPLSTRLVWGMFPLWMIDIITILFLGFLAQAFASRVMGAMGRYSPGADLTPKTEKVVFGKC